VSKLHQQLLVKFYCTITFNYGTIRLKKRQIQMPVTTQTVPAVRVADEVWIATALLHREQPQHPDFKIEEIVERARREAVTQRLRPGVYVHVVQHCVANRKPSPGRYRMLYETAPGRRRLLRKGDVAHVEREGAKMTPKRDEIPARYCVLIDWYFAEYFSAASALEADALLDARGSGKALWSSEPADEYIRRLREGWL